MVLSLPIIITARGGIDLAIFPSIAKAESHLEAIDVRNNEYKAFDTEGRLLQIAVEEKKRFLQLGGDTVQITLAESEPNHSEELRQRLEFFLKAEKKDVNSNVSLSELITTVGF